MNKNYRVTIKYDGNRVWPVTAKVERLEVTGFVELQLQVFSTEKDARRFARRVIENDQEASTTVIEIRNIQDLEAL